MIGATTGSLFGYIVGASLQDMNFGGWKLAFYVQAVLMFCVVVSYVFTPKKYLMLRKETPRILAHQGKIVEKDDDELPFWEAVKQVMCNASFHRFSFAVSFLYFVVTCI